MILCGKYSGPCLHFASSHFCKVQETLKLAWRISQVSFSMYGNEDGCIVSEN
ncbi:unnamed protein product [Brassica rapa]|uniref:Uncharacterized protein n=1 Tax=Brassica campestris TaxID=3711 RepID=A0A3P5ZDX0_BRACM|nr:unnamed protein product [Brassica rapa]VDC71050.1 unnamed protein product [Brassica rapa]